MVLADSPFHHQSTSKRYVVLKNGRDRYGLVLILANRGSIQIKDDHDSILHARLKYGQPDPTRIW